jgi:predicted nucleic acid-binding protein
VERLRVERLPLPPGALHQSLEPLRSANRLEEAVAREEGMVDEAGVHGVLQPVEGFEEETWPGPARVDANALRLSHAGLEPVTLQFPEGVFSALRRSPDEFARELRLAAAIHWYGRGEVSQEKACLAGAPIVVPEAVAREVLRWGEDDPARRALAWDLGAGESVVLGWALAHPGVTAVIEDLAARRCAQALRLPVRGTLGLVLTARSRGSIPSARRVLGELREAGMYLSDAVADRALALVGE